MGISPDIIILRADGSVGSDIRRKISTFCNVKPECVIENLTMPSLYQCPLMKWWCRSWAWMFLPPT